MTTCIVAAVLAAIVVLIIRSMIWNKRNGKSIQCGCDCKKCGGCCH